MKFFEELQWRGLIHDVIPGTQEQLEKVMTTGYIGLIRYSIVCILEALFRYYCLFIYKERVISLLLWLEEPLEWLVIHRGKVKKGIYWMNRTLLA